MKSLLPPAPAYIITATDTDAGKTTAMVELLRINDGRYWKPMQSGRDAAGRTDTDIVRATTGLPDTHFLPETYCLTQPLSPHRAAELDGVVIDLEKILDDYKKHLSCFTGYAGLVGPAQARPHASCLYIEGAGGLMVPVTRDLLQIDLFVQMQAVAPTPIILVARTALGTINHTLLSLEAIRARGLPLAGVLFCGPENDDNIQTILDFARRNMPITNLGHLSFPHSCLT